MMPYFSKCFLNRTKIPLTNRRLGPDIPRVRHRMQNRPVPVHRDGHQAEDRNRAQHDQQRDRKQARVQIPRQTHRRKHRKRNPEQPHEEIRHRQGHDVKVGPPAESPLPFEHHNDHGVADDGHQGHETLEHGVGHVQGALLGALDEPGPGPVPEVTVHQWAIHVQEGRRGIIIVEEIRLLLLAADDSQRFERGH